MLFGNLRFPRLCATVIRLLSPFCLLFDLFLELVVIGTTAARETTAETRIDRPELLFASRDLIVDDFDFMFNIFELISLVFEACLEFWLPFLEIVVQFS